MATILLIDDDLSLLADLETTLADAGYAVLRASAVEQGFQLWSDDAPELVVLEVDIDGGEGWRLLPIMTENGTPVIVITSRAREEEVVRALEAGAADVIAKPYRTGELLARIRTRLSGRGAQSASNGAAIYEQPAPTPTVARSHATNRERQAPPPPLFMTESDEQALIAEQPAQAEHSATTGATVRMPAPEPLAQHEVEALPLGARLRAARQSRHQSLVQVNLETPSKVAIWYLQAMEEEKFGLLPRGQLAAQMVREYATYLGLDADHALADFRAQHDVTPFTPAPHLGGRAEPRQIPHRIWTIAGIVLALAVSIGGLGLLAPRQMRTLGSNIRAVFVRPTTAAPPPATARPTASRATPRATARPTVVRRATTLPTASGPTAVPNTTTGP